MTRSRFFRRLGAALILSAAVTGVAAPAALADGPPTTIPPCPAWKHFLHQC